MFPPGYMGNYLNWIINVSEVDTSRSTTKSPLTQNGNTHNHLRFPTHIGIDDIMVWMVYKKPIQKQVYVLNIAEGSQARTVTTIFRMDPDAVIINLHDDNNEYIKKLGALNMTYTWPTFLDVMMMSSNNSRYKYNPFDDANTDLALVWLVHNWEEYFRFNYKIDKVEVMNIFDSKTTWFNIREKTGNGEITTDHYNLFNKFPDHCYDICIMDIVTNNFIPMFTTILERAKCGNFNFSYALNYHNTYINNRPNKEWFSMIDKFNRTKIVDPWFNKHILRKAFIIHEFIKLDIAPDNWELTTYDDIIGT